MEKKVGKQKKEKKYADLFEFESEQWDERDTAVDEPLSLSLSLDFALRDDLLQLSRGFLVWLIGRVGHDSSGAGEIRHQLESGPHPTPSSRFF